MARIEGETLPGAKRVEYGLTAIFGVGLKSSRDILTKVKIDFNKRCKDLTDAEVAQIQKVISDGYRVAGALQKEITLNIRRLRDIGSYRGLRHKKSLPTRGQRTKTNSRTRKGPKKTGSASSGKRKVAKK